MKQGKFSIQQTIKSFNYAFNGLSILIKEERNARIHLCLAVCVLIAGFVLKISTLEWVSIMLAMGFVIVLETINSAIENLADFISPEKHEKIKRIKDLSAAAVLLAALTALIIGLLIFVPKILSFC